MSHFFVLFTQALANFGESYKSFLLFWIFFLRKIYWLKWQAKYGESETILIGFPNSHRAWAGPGWSQIPRISSKFSTCVQHSIHSGYLLLPSKVLYRGSGSKVEQPVLELMPIWDAIFTGGSFTTCTMTTAPEFYKWDTCINTCVHTWILCTWILWRQYSR